MNNIRVVLTDDEKVVLQMFKEVELEGCPRSGQARHLEFLLQQDFVQELSFRHWEITTAGKAFYSKLLERIG